MPTNSAGKRRRMGNALASLSGNGGDMFRFAFRTREITMRWIISCTACVTLAGNWRRFWTLARSMRLTLPCLRLR